MPASLATSGSPTARDGRKGSRATRCSNEENACAAWMVLGNSACLVGVEPQETLAVFVDEAHAAQDDQPFTFVLALVLRAAWSFLLLGRAAVPASPAGAGESTLHHARASGLGDEVREVPALLRSFDRRSDEERARLGEQRDPRLVSRAEEGFRASREHRPGDPHRIRARSQLVRIGRDRLVDVGLPAGEALALQLEPFILRAARLTVLEGVSIVDATTDRPEWCSTSANSGESGSVVPGMAVEISRTDAHASSHSARSRQRSSSAHFRKSANCWRSSQEDVDSFGATKTSTGLPSDRARSTVARKSSSMIWSLLSATAGETGTSRSAGSA